MAKLQFKHIYKVYEGGVRAVSDFNLEIDDKEFVVFVGPSGCGKTTTLRMIAGLEEITAGELYIDGKKVNDVEPKDRNIAMVFQNYALYPHMSVFQNMGFGLKLRRLPKEQVEERVNRAAQILGIFDLLARKPKALSGGQRQRVALGRAIVREPNVFLLDEPLSNLDAKLRVQMRTEITKLHKRLQTTFIYVTHDQTEAMTMGDRIVVMKDGFIQQADTPTTLYEQPANVFVATFLGSPQMNIINANLTETDGKLVITFGEGQSAVFGEIKAKRLADRTHIGKEVFFGIRPENITLGSSGVDAEVDAVEHLGSETIIYATVKGLSSSVVVTIPTDHSYTAGQDVKLVFDMDKSHVFDAVTKQSVMGVPETNEIPCKLESNRLTFGENAWQLTEEFCKKLFPFAQERCVKLAILSDKVSLTELPDCQRLCCTIDFTVQHSDNVVVYAKLNGKDGYFVFKQKRSKLKSGDKVELFIPDNAIALLDQEGDRVNSREVVSSNRAKCRVNVTSNGVKIKVGAATLFYPDLQGVASGNYTMTLIPDKLGFVYSRKYAKKNKIEVKKQSNTLSVSAYDEDCIGKHNTVFVKVKGFDDYVTAVLPNDFSVYKMPKFKIVLNEDSFILSK